MDRNLLTALTLSVLIFLGWMMWQTKVVLPERRAAAEQAAAEEAAREQAVADRLGVAPTESEAPAGDLVPPSPAPVEDDRPVAGAESAADAVSVPEWSGVLESEVVRAAFSNRGATMTSLQLKRWFETPREEVRVELLDLPAGVPRTFATPFPELGLGDLSSAMFEVEHADAERIVFVLRRGGIVVRKTFGRPDERYRMPVTIEVENGTSRSLAPRFGLATPAAVNQRPDFKELSLIAFVDGKVTREPVQGIGTPGFLGRLFGGGDEGPLTIPSGVEWGGLDLRYFAALVVPADPGSSGMTFLPLEPGKVAVALLEQRAVDVSPGSSVRHGYEVFTGPKQPALLQEVGHDISLSTGRGWSWLAPLTSFFEWALHRVHEFLPNYGVAIIVLTLLVRLATWPIMVRQMKSAERMRELMPRIKELQEKYKDDRQKQSEETFKLYRETGVNPLGGCLPMVLQLPVFIGLFYALQSSIDLRHAPFFLWIDDLSAPATLFTLPGLGFPVRVLPILMGISMYAQQKMMPQTGMDPAQAKMMQIMMPGMMLVISYTFPSGLVLYWMVSNVLGIAHQLYVRKRMQAGEA